MKRFIFTCAVIGLFFLYKNWFLTNEIIGGDWPHYYDETIQSYPFFAPSWDPLSENGMGGLTFLYSLDNYLHMAGWLTVIGFSFPWVFAYKVFYYFAFLMLSVIGSYRFVRYMLLSSPFNTYLALIGSMIFTTNTYILMVSGGGQAGIFLSYSLTPWVLLYYTKLVQQKPRIGKTVPPKIYSKFAELIHSFFHLITLTLPAGLLLAFQIMFDARISVITCIVLLFISLNILINRHLGFKVIAGYCVSIIIIVFLSHAYWLIPAIIYRSVPVVSVLESHTTEEAYRFFSFATFPDALSILHPFWPENIFGKVQFFRPIFLISTIIAYSGLLFLKKKQKSTSCKDSLFITFYLLGLTGVFLSKGASEPFSFINLWLFLNVPGFGLFRDPTKFYLLTIIAYVYLIPFSLMLISRDVSKRAGVIAMLLFVGVWTYTLLPAFKGELNGTFSPESVPKEYINLKDHIYEQNSFFRTLWIPRGQRFLYQSYLNPAVAAFGFFDTNQYSDIIDALQRESAAATLRNSGIKYLIIPTDPYGEIFVRDRQYDDIQRKYFVRILDSLPWLVKLSQFTELAVYEVADAKGKFWSETHKSLPYYASVSTGYQMYLNDFNDPELILNERYDPYWEAHIQEKIIKPVKNGDGLNSFSVDKGTYNIKFVYSQEKIYIFARYITLLFLGTVLVWYFKLVRF